MHSQHPNISRRDINDWLKSQDTHTLYKSVRRKFKRNRVYVECIDQQWDADLVDMQEIRNKNDGVKYILTVIDILSWYAWTRPLLSKTAESTNTAFKDIMDISDRSALWIRTDKGGEFAKLKSFTNHFVTQNEPKANYAQRFIKTLKKMITKKMFHANSVSYIDDLQALTKSYNDSYHSSIKMAPSQVNKSNEGVFFAVCATLFSEA